jgi:hypothetical protein
VRPYASLSLDLDNAWSYLKTRGDASWASFPSYLDVVVPRALELFASLDVAITFFVVGQDAALPQNAAAMRLLAESPHEIGNHSFHHEPWIASRPYDEVREELADAQDAIFQATGRHAIGFRGPGYAVSPALVDSLVDLHFAYDCSSLPTSIGPLARAYYFATSGLSADERRERAALFGSVRDGFRPLRPYCIDGTSGAIFQIPVTTFPLIRLPFHFSYLLFIAERLGAPMAHAYFASALAACRMSGISPSLLLHPLDILGGDEAPELRFFPAMRTDGAIKRDLIRGFLQRLREHFTIVTMGEHARRAGLHDARLGAESHPHEGAVS